MPINNKLYNLFCFFLVSWLYSFSPLSSNLFSSYLKNGHVFTFENSTIQKTSKRKAKKEKEPREPVLLKGVPLIASFKNPLIVIMMTATLLLIANSASYKNHHFHLRSSWVVHKNQICNQVIRGPMRSLTLHYAKALPVTQRRSLSISSDLLTDCASFNKSELIERGAVCFQNRSEKYAASVWDGALGGKNRSFNN